MGNQPSTPTPPGSSYHARSQSSRHRPHSRRAHPTSSARNEPPPWTPDHADSPKSPDLRPQSPSLSLSPSLSRSVYSNDSRSAGVSPAGTERIERGMGNSQSNEAGPDRETRRRNRGYEGHSSPVQVPAGQSGRHGRESSVSYNHDAARPAGSEDYGLRSNLNFPPRLPLPIQEELYTPGSPILTSADFSQDLREDSEGLLPHRTSLLSHTTADEDDDNTESELEATKGRTVPTEIHWRGDADKVYITGSFVAWSRKFRMHRDPNDAGLMTARLDLLPGTHHVKFIVDGDMQLSDELPTAVDYTNILVNYIEVSADDIPHEILDDHVPQGLHPPLVHPPGVEQHDFAPQALDESKEQTDAGRKYVSTTAIHYSDVIPQYLPDLDRDESSNRFRRSANHINDIPTPPSLPMFLGKSILNGTTPMKDDSSVLNMPNHTVLNHLATSSIKNDVLATSLTTRYKRKYVTTITYRPTKEDE